MATLETTTDRFRGAVESLTEPLASSILIDLGDTGAIRIDGVEVTNDRRTADLVVQVSADDFRAMGSGELDPMVAMMTGRLRISNMMLAMQLRPVLLEMFKQAR